MDSNNEYGTFRIQKYYLSVLADFDHYCRINGIKYSLSDGTLLGAVRHKGFIPWDDDVDIILTRPNYEMFLHCFASHPMEGYMLIGKLWIRKLTKKNNPLLATEEQCIDLFVFDDVPQSKILQSLKILLLKLLQGTMKENLSYDKYPLKYKVLSFVAHVIGLPFSKKTKQRLYDKLMQWKGFGCGKEFGVYNTLFNYMGITFPVNVISDYVYLNFENRECMAMVGYDEYLKRCYGDYMTPPPKSERKPQHIDII